MSAHESMEHAEHAEHASSENRKIALLIAVIALFLALSETLGKGAQTESISKNVEASNLWAFFQAKRMRGTSYELTAEVLAALKEPEPFELDTLARAADRQVNDLVAAEKSAQKLRASLAQVKDAAAKSAKDKVSLLVEVGKKAIAQAREAAAAARAPVKQLESSVITNADAATADFSVALVALRWSAPKKEKVQDQEEVGSFGD